MTKREKLLLSIFVLLISFSIAWADVEILKCKKEIRDLKVANEEWVETYKLLCSHLDRFMIPVVEYNKLSKTMFLFDEQLDNIKSCLWDASERFKNLDYTLTNRFNETINALNDLDERLKEVEAKK
ncbi:hypothetical protein M0R19_07905 [Candidatus Pacearchaeota archaeon]|jgi:hypothetical protein|nr:hypothetical protein [bacterium]MCK9597081.1 hypothetical protein [Candidatus Pacearchaeota archaeon]